MAKKTDTAVQTRFHRKEANDARNYAIFEFDADPARPELTRITLPEKSTWSPGPHWHEQHVEYFRVVKGRVTFTMNGVERTVSSADGPLHVDHFVVHNFCRADRDLADGDKDDGEVVTEEWTDPADGIKHVFFRNIFSVLQDGEKYWGSWTYPQALLVAATYDDFIQVVPGRLSYLATHILYASVRFMGPLLGLRPWYEEYTPIRLREVAQNPKDVKME